MISANRKRQNTKGRQPAELGASAPFKFIVTGFNSFGKNLENPSGLTAASLPSELKIGEHLVQVDRLLLDTCCTNGWKAVRKSLVGKQITAALEKLSDAQSGNGKGTHGRGINGINGVNGIDGINGINGTNGTNGTNGKGNHAKPSGRTVLILMGLAATREALNLERLALNVRDYPIKDNLGHQYDGEEILPGPLALQTDFPLVELRKKLLSKGYPCTISNHAGTFVCNDLYYQCLTFKETYGTPDLVLFIHVPKAHVFARAVREKGSKQLKEFTTSRLTRTKQIELLNRAILEVIKFSVNYLEKDTQQPELKLKPEQKLEPERGISKKMNSRRSAVKA